MSLGLFVTGFIQVRSRDGLSVITAASYSLSVSVFVGNLKFLQENSPNLLMDLLWYRYKMCYTFLSHFDPRGFLYLFLMLR